MAARTALSRETVLREALAIIDEEGLEALTMRRLGQRLDRNPMTLYRYAGSRAELLDAVVETVFALLPVADGRAPDEPGPDEQGPAGQTPWQERLLITARRFRQLALQHPNVVPLIATRPLVTPLGMRPLGTLLPLEQILGLLHDAGFPLADALRVFRAYYGVLLGHVLTELQEVVAAPDETDALLRLGLHRLPPREFPHIRALADAFASYDGASELDRNVTAVLTGLTTALGPAGGR